MIHQKPKPAGGNGGLGQVSSKQTEPVQSTPRQESIQVAPQTALSTISVGQHIGHFEILALDLTGKRLLARCICGRTLPLGTEAVTLGVVCSCGCRPPPLLNRAAFREELARQQRQREMAP